MVQHTRWWPKWIRKYQTPQTNFSEKLSNKVEYWALDKSFYGKAQSQGPLIPRLSKSEFHPGLIGAAFILRLILKNNYAKVWFFYIQLKMHQAYTTCGQRSWFPSESLSIDTENPPAFEKNKSRIEIREKWFNFFHYSFCAFES